MAKIEYAITKKGKAQASEMQPVLAVMEDSDGDSMSPREIASILGVESAEVTKYLKDADKRGLVRKTGTEAEIVGAGDIIGSEDILGSSSI